MSTKKDNNIQVIQMSNYVRPKVVENKTQNWVMNGRKNEFYQYIIDRHNGSPTNSAINDSYINLIYGRGLYLKSGSPDDFLTFSTMLRPREVKKVVSDFQIFGEASMQIVPKRVSKNLPTIYHIAKEKTIPSIQNEDCEILSYWHSKDWDKQYKPENKPEEFPVFGTSQKETQVYVIKPYRAGKEYFSDPDYLSGLQYAELEEEISNFSINHIKNGLSFGYIINFPIGADLNTEEKKELKKEITEKLSGSSNSGKIVMNFSDAEKQITVEVMEVSDAHKQWDFLTELSESKILRSHKCTSPSIVGIIPNTGFASTADEMDMAEKQLVKRVITPKQDYIIEALQDIARFYDLNIELGFKPLTKEEETEEEETEPVVAELKKKASALDEFIAMGEDEPTETHYLIDEREVDYNDDKIELASTGTARPNSKSSQDNEDIIVRYKYTGNKNPEREFCKKMINAGKIYRKEDIIQMGSKPVNPGFGMDGTDTYSIWLYKGGGLLSETFPGGTCKHKWNRVIYLRKGRKVDVNSPLAEVISTSEAIRRGYKVETNDSLVSIAPHDNK